MRKAKKIESLRSLSLLYSTSTIRRLLNENSLSSIEKKVKKHQDSLSSSNSYDNFYGFLTELYNQMVKNYCNEYIYKNTILNKLLIGKYSLQTTTLLNEFKIGKSIADLVLINGEVKLFEIKTDLDNLNRLDSQLEDYKKAAEKIYIVTNSKYIRQIEERYGLSCYGIIELSKAVTLKVHKEANEDKTSLDHTTIFKLLRKQEYLNIIEGRFGQIPNVPNTLLFRECLKMVKGMDIKEFQNLAFKQLKQRKLNEPELLLSSCTPKELRFLCYSLNLKENQYKALHKLLNQSL